MVCKHDADCSGGLPDGSDYQAIVDDPNSDIDNYEESFDESNESIDNFVRKKVIAMKLLNQKIDFYEFEKDQMAVRYNEVFIPGISMNKYSDTGYRFRYNLFERFDTWYWFTTKTDFFFDYMFYNSDTYESAPSGAEDLIGEMYFRLEVDQITHGRVVYTLMDFIGALGGVSDLLLQILGWIIGGYAAFHSSVATISALYKVKTENTSIFSKSK